MLRLLVGAGLIFIPDRITKIYFFYLYPKSLEFYFTPNISLKFQCFLNKGGFWGILPRHNFGLLIFGFIILTFIFLYLYLKGKKWEVLEAISWSCLIGGIIGNLYDRLFYGGVIDFIIISWKDLSYPAFNLADVSICCGVLFLLKFMIKKDYSKR